jgi:hypothetical protein
MKFLCGLLALTTVTLQTSSQDLTVKVLHQDSNAPVSNALIRLHYGCWHSMRPIELKQKTNAQGIAIFHSLSLTPHEFCVFLDRDVFASAEQTIAFSSPSEAAQYSKFSGTIKTTLPAEITFYVRRLSFGERLRWLFSNP